MILCVDDEVQIVEGMLSSLEGHSVVFEQSFEQAMEHLRTERFDTLLIDQRMADDRNVGGATGAPMIKRLFADEDGEAIGIPFVVMADDPTRIEFEYLQSLPGFLSVVDKGS